LWKTGTRTGTPNTRPATAPTAPKISEEQDFDSDGKPEVQVTYKRGRKHRVKEDTNKDGRSNLETVYADDGSIKQRRADTTGDGRFDTTSDYQGGADAQAGPRFEPGRHAGSPGAVSARRLERARGF